MAGGRVDRNSMNCTYLVDCNLERHQQQSRPLIHSKQISFRQVRKRSVELRNATFAFLAPELHHRTYIPDHGQACINPFTKQHVRAATRS
eukprot:6093-Heterococcus_DN1.PRE.1